VKRYFHMIRVRQKVWKCSFLDNEPILKYEHYLGKRAKRGPFLTATGLHVNAEM